MTEFDSIWLSNGIVPFIHFNTLTRLHFKIATCSEKKKRERAGFKSDGVTAPIFSDGRIQTQSWRGRCIQTKELALALLNLCRALDKSK